MPYILNKTNGSIVATVADGSINQTTDLTFVGKNYSGYGEIINENLIKLLENFSNNTKPPKAIAGQLWYNPSERKLSVYNGTMFQGLPKNVYGNTKPSNLDNGDFWFNTSSRKLYVKDGVDFTLIGPTAGSGATAGASIIATTVYSSADLLKQNPRPVYLHTINPDSILVVSRDSVTSLSVDDPLHNRFNSLKPGINLPNVVEGISTGATPYYFHGTATDSIRLDGKLSTDFVLQSEYNSNKSSGFNIDNDNGIIVGPGSGTFQFHSADAEGKLTAINGTKISFNLRYPAISDPITNILNITGNRVLPGPTVNVDIGSADVNSRFNAIYTKTIDATTVTATTLTGTLSGIVIGNVTGNLTGNVNGNITGNSTGTHTGNVTTRLITTGAAGTSGSIIGAWTLSGSSTLQATYADLAERYEADAVYESGTVLMHGGEKEVTIATFAATTAVAGIVSKNPAYMMNSDAGTDETHPYIALKGRVPCKIVGPVKKGDLLVASGYKAGYAVKKQAHDSSDAVIGKALENFEGSFGVIEVKV